MPTFKLRVEAKTYYEHEVEADTLEEAIEIVEAEDDRGSLVAIEYAIEGQTGWNDVE